MITIEADCRRCSHEKVCVKMNDYNSYIFDAKQTEQYLPEGVQIKINCLDFKEETILVKSSGLCCAPGFGNDRPSVEYSSGV